MKTTLRQIGNSEGVILPKTLLALSGLVDDVEITLEKGALVLRRAVRARTGWAAASRAIAAAGDEREANP